MDYYSYYVLFLGIDSDIFWHSPISEVLRVAENKQIMDAWQNNPKIRGG